MTTTRETPDLVGAGPHRPRGSRIPYLVGALMLALVLGAFAGFWLTEDSTTKPAPQPSATTQPTTSPASRATIVWPFQDGPAFTDPVAVAKGFASDYLGFKTPVTGTFRQGDTRSGEVDVRPVANGPVTTVLVRQVLADGTWSVLGASTETIEITAPATGALVTSPVTVTGRALAFEGTVQVEVREDGDIGGLGRGFVTGGGDVMRPFEGSITFEESTQAYGSLILYTVSGENGQPWAASVIRLRFR